MHSRYDVPPPLRFPPISIRNADRIMTIKSSFPSTSPSHYRRQKFVSSAGGTPEILTSDRKQKRRSAAETRPSSMENQPLFESVTARKMSEGGGRVAARPSDDRDECGASRSPTRYDLEVDTCGLSGSS